MFCFLLTGVALKSCTKFIEFLNEAKDDDSTEDEN